MRSMPRDHFYVHLQFCRLGLDMADGWSYLPRDFSWKWLWARPGNPFRHQLPADTSVSSISRVCFPPPPYLLLSSVAFSHFLRWFFRGWMGLNWVQWSSPQRASIHTCTPYIRQFSSGSTTLLTSTSTKHTPRCLFCSIDCISALLWRPWAAKTGRNVTVRDPQRTEDFKQCPDYPERVRMNKLLKSSANEPHG